MRCHHIYRANDVGSLLLHMSIQLSVEAIFQSPSVVLARFACPVLEQTLLQRRKERVQGQQCDNQIKQRHRYDTSTAGFLGISIPKLSMPELL